MVNVFSFLLNFVSKIKFLFIYFADGNPSWTNFEEHHHLLGNDEDNSERHSSDDDFDIWSITEEQREYYINQFKSMQPDLKKKITGNFINIF